MREDIRSSTDFTMEPYEPPQSPHKRLVNAVLTQAADDIRYLRQRLKQQRYPMPYMIDAALWAISDDKTPMSFEWCCEIVGRDPEQTRKKILAGINIERFKEAVNYG